MQFNKRIKKFPNFFHSCRNWITWKKVSSSLFSQHSFDTKSDFSDVGMNRISAKEFFSELGQKTCSKFFEFVQCCILDSSSSCNFQIMHEFVSAATNIKIHRPMATATVTLHDFLFPTLGHQVSIFQISLSLCPFATLLVSSHIIFFCNVGRNAEKRFQYGFTSPQFGIWNCVNRLIPQCEKIVWDL